MFGLVPNNLLLVQILSQNQIQREQIIYSSLKYLRAGLRIFQIQEHMFGGVVSSSEKCNNSRQFFFINSAFGRSP